MNASRLLGLAALGLWGCPAAISDPPPPPSKPEIVMAPPRALGALAAGTDAAPRPDRTLVEPGPALPLPHGGGLVVPDPDGGQAPSIDGGRREPPDAGTAL